MSQRPHDPIAIANYFIERSKCLLTLMQILKLSYFAHGFKLGLESQPLSREFAQAWKYGPVFPSIYNEFSCQPPGEIKELGTGEIDDDPILGQFDKGDKDIMNFVYDVYGKMSGWKLSALTHKEGTPWYKAFYEGDEPGKDYNGVPILNKEIKRHFEYDIIKKILIEPS